MDTLRPEYINIMANDFEDVAGLGFDLWQEKIDGHWCAIKCAGGRWSLHKRTGRKAYEGVLSGSFEGVITGELLIEGGQARVLAFDLLQARRGATYADRADLLASVLTGLEFKADSALETKKTKALAVSVLPFHQIDENTPGDFKELLDMGSEGMVFRNSSALDYFEPVGRMKRFIDVDLFIDGCNFKADNAFKSLRLVDGRGFNACNVRSGLDADSIARFVSDLGPGHANKLKGRCVRVYAQQITKAGRLRHPVFLGFHSEK